MPNEKNVQTGYWSTGNPDTVNDQTPYFPGQVGQVTEWENKTYQYVQLDSAAGALATPAANDVLYWKDRPTYVVTTDIRFSNGARNNVAGILRNAATPGYYIGALQRGDAISVKSDGGGAVGDTAVADATATQITQITAGTAPTYMPLGKFRGAPVANVASVDLNIPSAP